MVRAGPEPATGLPTGLVTLMFTDIEGSTNLLHQLGDAYGDVLADHHRLLRTVWQQHRGVEVGTEGDAFFVAFRDAEDAVAAAQAAQLALRRYPWPRGFEVRVRMGIHRGTPQVRDAEYWGIDVHYAARVCAAAHGGQVLLSDSVATAVDVPSEDLGMLALKDFPAPRRLFHLLVDGVGSDAFPPVRALRAGRTNLPDQRSSLIGRRREIEEVTALLEHHRMVTLAGPGGVGKTRLALQVGAMQLDGSGDGVWLAELAGLADRHALASSVANVLGVTLPAGRPPIEAFAEQLADRRLLLVLDNCEHLLDAVAELADGMLRQCPSVKVLATSREPAGIAGETVYRVPSLDVPIAAADLEDISQSQAVQLLVERAASHRRGFVLDDTNACDLAAIARRLDGIPLAIELAAAWLRRLSVTELRARLERGFELLSGIGRMTPSRQQTIQAMIDWSYDLLNPDEQRLLNRLSVFAGGFDLAAAEDVCGESIGTEVIFGLGALVDKSLVQVQDTRGELRYRLLETVRAYAAAKLDALAQAGPVRDAHLCHYLAVAEAMAREPDGRQLPAWLDRIAIEHDNMRAAFAHSLSGSDPDLALRLAAALSRFRDDRGFGAETAADLARALALPGADRPTRARAAALVGLAGRYSFQTGDRQQLLACSQEALEIARTLGDDELVARALGWRIYLLGRNGDWAAALESAELAHSAAARTGLVRLISRTLVGKAGAMINLGRDARTVLAEAAELSRRNGDLPETARVLNQLGLAEITAGEYAAARAALSDALEIATELGLRGVRLVSLVNLGFGTYLDGDADAAAEHHRAALTQTIEDRDHGIVPYALLGIALSDTACGRSEQAAMLHGAVDALLASRNEHLETLEAGLREQDVARLRDVLGDEQFAERHGTGAQKPVAEVFAAALAGDETTSSS